MARIRRSVLTTVACGLAVGACATPKDPGVTTEALQADIVFAATAPEDADATIAPVSLPVGENPQEIELADLTTFDTPFRNKIPDRFKNVPTGAGVGAVTQATCPQAPLGDAPDVVAPEVPKGLPVEGVYRYKVTGTRKTTYENGSEVTAPINTFQVRVVQNVTRLGETKWTYEMVQPAGDGGIVITTYSVNAAATQRQVSPPYVGENAIRVTEPDAGLSIAKVVTINASGTEQEFAPLAPVAVAQFPVLSGQSFTSVGISPRGQTMRVDGEALTRKAVDACGKFTDGWAFKGVVQDSQGATTNTYEQELIVATDRGALVISQQVKTARSVGAIRVEDDLTFSIGQLTPDPLPESTT